MIELNKIKIQIMDNNTYILQKDLPGLKAGEEFINSDKLYYYPIKYMVGANLPNSGHGITFPTNVVENNPEWFKLKKHNYTVRFSISVYNNIDKLQEPSYHNFFYIDDDQVVFSNEKYDAIKKAIENIFSK